MLRAGTADAFALSRNSLPPFVADFPGSRIVDGGFQQTGIAVAVPKGRPEALAVCHALDGRRQGVGRGPPRARPGRISGRAGGAVSAKAAVRLL